MTRDPKREVEPLSDASWQRIERGVFRALDEQAQVPEAQPVRRAPARRAYGFVLAGAAAAVLAVVALKLVEKPAETNAPSRIVTADSGTHVVWGEATLDVAAQSALLVSGDDARGVLVVLDRGEATFEVAPRKHRPPFLVQAGEVRVRVVGTRFSVARAGDSATVSVEHGVVEVTAAGHTTRVAAGDRWPALAAAEPEPESESEPVPDRVPAPPRVTHHAPPRPHVVAAPPPAAPTIPAVVPPPPAPAPSPQDQYEAAARLEARDPNRAIALYRDLAQGSTVWSQNALYAHGRLEADRGHRDEARRLLRSYLTRFPRGPNAEDARQLLDRLR